MKRPFDITFVLTYNNGDTTNTVNVKCNLDFWMGALFFDASVGGNEDTTYITCDYAPRVYKQLNRFTQAFTDEEKFKALHSAAAKNTENHNGVSVCIFKTAASNATTVTNYLTNNPNSTIGISSQTSTATTVTIADTKSEVKHEGTQLYHLYSDLLDGHAGYFSYIRYILSLIPEDKFAMLYEQFLTDCKAYIEKFQETLYFVPQETPYKIEDSTDYNDYESSIKELLNNFK